MGILNSLVKAGQFIVPDSANISNNYNISLQEEKAFQLDEYNLLGYNYSTSLGWYDISALIAWYYYKTVSPIYRASNLIANEFSSIEIVLKDRKTGDIIKEQNKSIPASDVLRVLENPNFDKTGNEFKKQLALTYIVPGTAYLQINGINKIQEIYVRNPQNITVYQGNDNYPERFFYSGYGFTEEYKRDKDYRFFNRSLTQELYQIAEFNPNYQSSQIGLSILSPVYYEIEQYYNACLHNASILKNGARLSGIIIAQEQLSKEQREDLRKQAKVFFSGANNAGKIMITGGVKDFKELSLTNKDMDFFQLTKLAKQTIYEVLNIPATFYDNSASSYNNKTTDRISLYDFAVLPIAKRIVDELTLSLLNWYKDGERYKITFLENEIPALRTRKIQETKEKVNIGVFTDNEIRSMLGADEIQGGDFLYKPSALIPVGKDDEVKEYTQYLETKGYTQEQIK